MAAGLRSICFEADDQAALEELERIWETQNGTPEGGRLDGLATLIDHFEAKRQPIDLPDPAAAIRFRMEQQGQPARTSNQ